MAPTTLEPTTLEPTTLKPTTLEPTTLKPTTLEPTTLEPTTLDPATLEPATLEPTTLTEDGLDAVLSWLDPTQLFCQGALVCREWHAAATAPHRRRAAASQRYGEWATAGPVSRWLEAHVHAPRAVLSGTLVVLSAGSNTGPEDWGVPTPPPEAHGQLGRAVAAAEGPCTLRPVGIPGFGIPFSQQVCAVAAGGYHCWALTTVGTAWAWGANAFGMLGLGDRASRQLPQPVALPDAAEAVEVVCGFAFTLVRLGLSLSTSPAPCALRPAPCALSPEPQP